MLAITCPQCAKQIGVPDDAAGKKVRCPLCQGVFQVPVQAAVPVAIPVPQAPAVVPSPLPQERLPSARNERVRESALLASKNTSGIRDVILEPDARDQDEGEERSAILRRAHSKVRGAATLLYLAPAFDFLIALVFIWNLFRVAESRGGDSTPVVGGLVLLLLVYVTPVVLIVIGASQLRKLGKRGLVINGSIMAFLVSALLLGAVVFCFVILMKAVDVGVNLPVHFYIGMVSYIIGVFANLFAGVTALVALSRPAVKEANLIKLGRPRPRRVRPEYRPRGPKVGGSALPLILGSVLGGLAVIGLVVVVVIVSQSEEKDQWAGKPKGPPPGAGQFKGEAKKGFWEEKKEPARPRFDDKLAQNISLEKGPFETQGRFEDTDPLDRDQRAAAKIFLVELEKGRAYLAEFKGEGNQFNNLRLRLEDHKGVTFASADWRPFAAPSAHLLTLPTQTETYRLVVSAYGGTSFRLSLRELEEGESLPPGVRLVAPPFAGGHSIQLAKRIGLFSAVAIAHDSKSAWVAFSKDPRTKRTEETLERFSCPDFDVQASYLLPKRIYQLAMDRRGILYAASQLENPRFGPPGIGFGIADIYLYDTSKLPAKGETLTPTKIIPIGGRISNLVVSPDDAWLYYLDIHNRKIGRIDLKEAKRDAENDQIKAGTRAMCLTPNGKTIYTCSSTNVVEQIDAATFKIEKTFSIDKGKPNGIQATDNGNVFLNSGEGQWTHIYLFNARRDTKGATVNVMPWMKTYQTSSIRLSPDQKRLYASCFNLSPANIASYAVSERPTLFPPGQVAGSIGLDAWSSARGQMEVSADGSFLFCDRGVILLLGR